MAWTNFAYLIAAAAAALLLFAFALKSMPDLCKPSKKRTRLELLLLGAATIIGLFAIYGNFYLEHSFFAYAVGDVGSDTIGQYVPFYANLLTKIQNGKLSTWNFEYELGVNNPGYQSWIYDPFNVIVIGLGTLLGVGHLSLVLVMSQSIKLLLSVFLFDHFLTFWCEKPASRILGSLLYGFSGFMILYGQHYWFGGAFPLFTLTILMFEVFLEKKTVPRFIGLTASIALVVGWTVYVAFMVLLFAVFYLLLRIPSQLEKVTPRAYVKEILWMCAPVICGCLIACITAIPYATFLLTETTRTSGTMPFLARLKLALTSFVHLSWFPAVLSRFLGSSLLNTGFDPAMPSITDIDKMGGFTYEFILLGYSCVCFILLSQFFHWIYTEAEKRTKILVGIGTALVLLYCFHRFLPTLFTAMVKLQYRSSFIIAMPVVLAMTIGFEKRILANKVALAPLLTASLITIAVIIWSLLNTVNGRLVCIAYFVVIIFVTALLVVEKEGFANHKVCATPVIAALFIGAAVASTVFDGFIATNCRRTVEGPFFPLYTKSGVGKDTEAALSWISKQDGSFFRVEKNYSDWTPLNDSLVQHYDGVSAYNSTPDSDVDEFYHKLWKSAIPNWGVYSQGFKISPDSPEILGMLNVKYILSRDPIGFSWCKLLKKVDDIYIYRNEEATSIVSLYHNAISEREADALPSTEARAEKLQDAIIIPDEIADTMAKLPESNTTARCEFKKESDSFITGTIDADVRSAAFVAIPNTGNWTIKVDGNEIPTIRANYGFMAFPVEAGHHKVEISYHIAGIKKGIVASCAGIACTAAFALFTSQRGRKHVCDA